MILFEWGVLVGILLSAGAYYLGYLWEQGKKKK